MAATDGEPRFADEPAALQQALRDLQPAARLVVKLEKQAHERGRAAAYAEESHTEPPPDEKKLASARAGFARELGRRAEAFSVLTQFAADDVLQAASAGDIRFSELVFPLLHRAHVANVAMRERVVAFVGIAATSAVETHPERALAEAVATAGQKESVWGFWKYVERANARIIGGGDDLTLRAVEEASKALGRGLADAEALSALAQAAGEMLVIGAAEFTVTKLVPVLNVAAAVWHISTAVTEFGKRREEFYCTLDPRDALVEVAPSALDLAFDIATEAVFAVF
jgi:hypothetical protein